MQTDKPTLFVEINESNFIFFVGEYDDNQNLIILEKIISPSEGINKNKFVNIEAAYKTIKQNVEILENKLNYIFKDVTIILDNFEYSCTNISGFKKLNGSQLLKENISYILNSLKLAVIENEKQKTILHIFNSQSILDGIRTNNLPIGLYGNFYNHELTFFLIENNDLKNINLVFNKNNLEVKKIFLKSFCEGVQLISQSKIETFFQIKIKKGSSNLSVFERSSFRYSQNFNFGTNIILKDISKICSIDVDIISNYLSDCLLSNESFRENEFLEEKYFIKGNYRKIRKKLITDIVDARIHEIIDIIFNNNTNIVLFKQNISAVYLSIQNELIYDSFKKNFEICFNKKNNLRLDLTNSDEGTSLVNHAANISNYGWKKEAIPISQIKNSIITRIFKYLFG